MGDIHNACVHSTWTHPCIYAHAFMQGPGRGAGAARAKGLHLGASLNRV